MTTQINLLDQYKSIIRSVLAGIVIGFLAAAVLYKAASEWTPDFLESSPVVFFGFFMIVCGLLGFIHAVVPDTGDYQKRDGRNSWMSSILTGALIGFLAAAVLYGNLPSWVPPLLSENPWVFFGLMTLMCAAGGYLYMKGDE